MSGSEGDGFTPATGADVADDNPRMIAGELRALKRDVNAGFELMTQKVLTRLDRFDQKLDVVIDRQNVFERRLDDVERRVAAQSREVANFHRWQSQSDERLTALENPTDPPARTVRRRKKRK